MRIFVLGICVAISRQSTQETTGGRWLLLCILTVIAVVTVATAAVATLRWKKRQKEKNSSIGTTDGKGQGNVTIPVHYLKLTVTEGPMRGEIFRIVGEAVLGRDTNVQCKFSNDPFVGRRHCRITCSCGKFYVEDLGSRNGTMVENHRIPENSFAELKDKDIIQIGNSKMVAEIT